MSEKYTIDAFFAGVGGIELGFEQTGYFETVYANEFDKNASKTYLANHDTDLEVCDIHDVIPSELPNSDLIVGGFPCQSFSIAGYRKGFYDENSGDLFFELLKMIREKQPRTIFMENVKNLVSHDSGKTFSIIIDALLQHGYFLKWKVLNSKDYGNIPQNRERIYIVGFRSYDDYHNFSFPDPVKRTTSLRDVIDFSNKVDDKYYYREGRQKFFTILKEQIVSQNSVYQWRRQYVRENKSGVVPTLTANMGTGGHNVPLILTDSGEIRKLTPKETFLIQGYPKDFKLPEDLSNSALYKQAGNSVTVSVIERIAENINEAMRKTDDSVGYKNDGLPVDVELVEKIHFYDKMSGYARILDYGSCVFEDDDSFDTKNASTEYNVVYI